MPVLEFPHKNLQSLQELGTRLLDSRKPGTPNGAFARELLVGFFETCMQAGLDRVLVELAEAHPPLELSDSSALADHPTLSAALTAQLDAIKLDGGGPRAAKPGQLAEGIVAALGLAVVEEPDRTITFDHVVRTAVAAALASVVEVELAVPQLRDAIITRARELCDPHHHGAFAKITAQLDDRGMRLIKMPKVPIDAVQATQRALFEARNAVFDRIGRAAIDRAKDALAQVQAAAAARIDEPVTLRLTPRDVAILRLCDARVPKLPGPVVESLLGSLSELAHLAWRAPERAIHPYAASQTFAVGDLIEHPTFGRGTVLSAAIQRIEVEFPDGKHTLAHALVRK